MNESVNIEKLGKEVLSFPDQAKTLVVKDPQGLGIAQAVLVAIKKMKLKVDQAFDPIIKKAHEAHREAISQKRRYTDPLDTAERLLKPKISAFLSELDRQRREAEKREREQLEAQKKAEEEQIQKAIEAEEKGDLEEAERILDQEPVKLAPVSVPEKPILSNIHTRMIWKWRVKDPQLVPREYLTLDTAKISQEVREKRDKADIPGIEIYQEQTVASRVS